MAKTFAWRPIHRRNVVTAQLMIRLQIEALAEAELERALARDPKTLRANYLLGQIALFRGQFEAAVDRSTRDLTLNPSDAMGRISSATRCCDRTAATKRSWRSSGRCGEPVLQRALPPARRAYMKKGHPPPPRACAARIEYDPNNAPPLLLAQLLQQQGRTEEATQAFAIAERLSTRGNE